MEFSTGAIVFAFSLTLFAGLSTGIGGLLALFIRQKNTVALSVGLGLSAGVMIYVSFVEILPKSVDSFIGYGDHWAHLFGVLCLFLGIGFSALIDRFIPSDINPHELNEVREFAHIDVDHDHVVKARALKRTGVFTALALAIHNFPEGFATFTVALVDPTLAIPIVAAVAIHNIPEGVAVSLPIYHATGSRLKGFLYAFSSGIAEPLGALVGYLLLAPYLNDITLGIVFGIVGGIMIYISFDELLPAAREYGSGHSVIGGLIAGMGIMAFSLVLFDFM
ncbi:zinc transporter ZupT [Chrysiogenes arsenatis]|uniref:zinc transporter ZupT n=1 Tax=Chrysiogenes arsenatis TaxID=309797 RepID=UPI000411463F|nr:zinc transporter ZupT [Chrysiogenes arsenatis]